MPLNLSSNSTFLKAFWDQSQKSPYPVPSLTHPVYRVLNIDFYCNSISPLERNISFGRAGATSSAQSPQDLAQWQAHSWCTQHLLLESITNPPTCVSFSIVPQEGQGFRKLMRPEGLSEIFQFPEAGRIWQPRPLWGGEESGVPIPTPVPLLCTIYSQGQQQMCSEKLRERSEAEESESNAPSSGEGRQDVRKWYFS